MKRALFSQRLLYVMFVGMIMFCSCKHDDEMVFSAIAPNYNSGAKDFVRSSATNSYICWNNGDRVRINNGEYTVTVDVNEDATIAADGVTACGGGYYAAYPASQASLSDSMVLFSLPETETFTRSGSNQIVHNLMVASTHNSTMQFRNVCSLLQFSISSSISNAKIAAIEVTADKALSGNITARCTNDVWSVTCPSGTLYTRTLHFDSPDTLSSVAKNYFLIVPPVENLASFKVKFYIEKSNGEIVVFEKTKSGDIDFVQSKGYVFSASFDGTDLSYGAGNYDKTTPAGSAEDPYRVFSDKGYKYTMRQYANKTKTIVVQNDITVDTTIATLNAILDCGGNTVTLSNPNKPMFNNVSNGTVKNVIVTAESAATAPVMNSNCFGFVSCISSEASSFENCTIDASINYTSGSGANTFIGGICGRADGTTSFSNCHNTKPHTATATHMGAIAGRCYGSMTNCSNSGDVTMIAFGMANVLLGGLAGQQTGVVSNCSNSGTVTIEGVGGTTETKVGGLFGKASKDIDDCVNLGEVNCNLTTSNSDVYIGGIAGHAGVSTKMTISNCYNNVNLNYGHVCTKTKVGGIAGFVNRADVKNCYALGNYEGQYAAGIVVYENPLESLVVSNCYYYGNLYTDNSNYRFGIVGNSETGVTVSYCYCPVGLTLKGSNVSDGGGNNTIHGDDHTKLSDGITSLAGLLNDHRESYKQWTDVGGGGYVVFVN